MTATQALPPCASPSAPQHDAGSRQTHRGLRDPNEREQSSGVCGSDAGLTRARRGHHRPSRGGGAGTGAEGEATTCRGGGHGGREQRCGEEEGKAVAGRHGSPRCHKKAGRGRAAHLSRPQLQQPEHHHQRNPRWDSSGRAMGTALAVRLGLGLLLLALLLPTQVSIGAARRFPTAGPSVRDGKAAAPRPLPSRPVGPFDVPPEPTG